MRAYVLAFLFALSATCLMGGKGQPVYVGTGINNVTTNGALAARRQEGGVGEINLVNIGRQYVGASEVEDDALEKRIDFPYVGRF